MDLLILSSADVDTVIQKFTAPQLVDLMARVFIGLAASESSGQNSEVAIPHRNTIASTNHRILFMPSRIAIYGTAVKIVSVPSAAAPADVKERGLPGSTAVLDEHTGEVIALVNARKLTALRNATSKSPSLTMITYYACLIHLGSLLATQLMLSRRNCEPHTLVAIGAGAQVAAHVSLFLTSYPTIHTCTIINRTLGERLTALIKSLEISHPNVRIEGLSLHNEAGDQNPKLQRIIQTANIIITATSSTTPLFPSSYVSSGSHLCLIGSYTPAMYVCHFFPALSHHCTSSK